MYMAMQGINLGGWLIAERWITPSLFQDTEAKDEYSLSILGKKYQKRIRQHHQSFITEEDIRWINYHNLKLLRVPVGYWIFGNEEPYTESIERLDWLFTMAKKYNLHILLDIHGAPGSQNGKQHSGKMGKIEWLQHISRLEQVSKQLFCKYKDHPSLWGIELLNEPTTSLRHIFSLWRYYFKISRWSSRQRTGVKIIVAEGRPYLVWALLARFGNMTLDYHVYHGFHGRTIDESFAYLDTFRRRLSIIHRITPVIVGEWSGVVSQKTNNKKMADYINTQKDFYEIADAWCYWTYKTEEGGIWSYRDMAVNTPKTF